MELLPSGKRASVRDPGPTGTLTERVPSEISAVPSASRARFLLQERPRKVRMTLSSATAHASTGVSISNLIVRLAREYTGRGPTKARTLIVENVVTVVLEDTLTRGERSLVEDGRGQLVLEMRSAFQDTMRREMIDGVALILGRPVRAMLSANHLDPDVAVETFLLGPATETSGPAVEASGPAVDPLTEVQY